MAEECFFLFFPENKTTEIFEETLFELIITKRFTFYQMIALFVKLCIPLMLFSVGFLVTGGGCCLCMLGDAEGSALLWE